MNKIIINGLKAQCIIGVKPDERLTPQQIIIDLELNLDLSLAGSSDDIKDTVDYDSLAQEITQFVEKSQFNLIEKLAFETAQLAKDISNCDGVTVTIKKPSALKNAEYTAVSVSLI